jgi:hypothetical protein
MKTTITALFAFFLAMQAQAQVTVKPGVRAGLNLSNFTNSDMDTKADFYVGGLVAIKLAKFYTLQPELTYTRQGAKAEYTEVSFDPIVQNSRTYEQDYSIQYISLGLMNKFNIVEGFHATVGPTIDFKVGDNFPDFADDELVGLDIAFNGGLGYTLPMGLTIEARYKLGFVDIFGDNFEEDYYDDYYDDDNGNYDDIILNSVIQLGLSYTF